MVYFPLLGLGNLPLLELLLFLLGDLRKWRTAFTFEEALAPGQLLRTLPWRMLAGAQGR